MTCDLIQLCRHITFPVQIATPQWGHLVSEAVTEEGGGGLNADDDGGGVKSRYAVPA